MPRPNRGERSSREPACGRAGLTLFAPPHPEGRRLRRTSRLPACPRAGAHSPRTSDKPWKSSRSARFRTRQWPSIFLSTAETETPAERIRPRQSAARTLDVTEQRIARIMVETAIRFKNLFEPCSGTVQPDLDGSERDSKHLSDLTVLHPFGFAEDQDGSIILRQLGNKALNAPAHLAPDRFFFDRGDIVFNRRARLARITGIVDWSGNHPSPVCGAPDPVHGGVRRDAVDPRRNRGFAPEAVQRPADFQEYLLRKVLRVIV